MNLRILKKLSKRAAPLLSLLGDHRKQFRANSGDSYTGILIRERKHYERIRSPHAHIIHEGGIKRPTADGRGFVAMWPPHHPRKGTVMVGAMAGYYEPEWDEETAYEALLNLVACHFTDWGEASATLTRIIKTPTDLFRAADDMLAEMEVA